MNTSSEWSREFDLMWNNITSNQAPGLTEYEKSVLLTRAQNDLVRDYMSGKTNILGEGLDDSGMRQADFISLIETKTLQTDTPETTEADGVLDRRSGNNYFKFPDNVLIILNEVVNTSKTINSGAANEQTLWCYFTVVPVSFDEYARLMKKPFKYPAKGIAWRLISGTGSTTTTTGEGQSAVTTTEYFKRAELIMRIPDGYALSSYTLRYVRKPKPIWLGTETDHNLTVDDTSTESLCELPEHLHQEILYRAVQLAKVAWSDPATLPSQK